MVEAHSRSSSCRQVPLTLRVKRTWSLTSRTIPLRFGLRKALACRTQAGGTHVALPALLL